MKLKIFLVVLLLTAVFCVSSVVFAQSMTEAQRQTLIAQIKAQIVQLEEQLAEMIAQQQGTGSWCYTFNNDIGYSNSGTYDVVNLHIALQKEGLFYGPDDISTYSSGTSQGVTQFQAKYGINPQTGFVGSITRNKLNQLYKCLTSSNTSTGTSTNTNNNIATCQASCANQTDGIYAIDCSGNVRKCSQGQTCQNTYSTSYSYNGSSVQTIKTLTGAQCTTSSTSTGTSTSTTTCKAACANQSDGVYAIDCSGNVRKCSQGQTCQNTYSTSYSYNGATVQTTQTLTGTQCTTPSTGTGTGTGTGNNCTASWQCTPFGVCVNNQQVRTCTFNGCGTATNEPTLTQSCSSPSCAEGNWIFALSPTTCPSTGQQIKTWSQIGTCSGGVSHPATETISCDYQATTCSSFTYSSWSPCVQSGVQTRSVLSSSPSGCTGGNPTISETCTYSTTCTDGNWTYVLSPTTCPSTGQQIKTWSQIGTCSGGVSHPTTETISCTYNSGCTPNCSGKNCGSNGCGGSCGICSLSYTCSASGTCVSNCTPNWSCGSWGTCAGGQQTKTCTDLNNCGVTTNKPSTTQSCCTPSCSGKNCGSDGCGSTCGTCSMGTCSSGHCSCSKDTDCGTSGYYGTPTCNSAYPQQIYQSYRSYTCQNPGTASSQCVYQVTDNKLEANCDVTKKQVCSAGACVVCYENWSCSSWGLCANKQQTRTCTDTNQCGFSGSYSNKPPTTQSCCSSNADCGSNGYTGSLSCSGSNIMQNYTTYTCNNPGTATSSCTNSAVLKIKQTCAVGQTCYNGACCTTKTCTQLNKKCGKWDNSCGGQVDCGYCNGGYCTSTGICAIP